MTNSFNCARGPDGEMLQSAVPKSTPVQGSALSAGGLLIRGVVTATYVFDEGNTPATGAQLEQVAIYCDVLAYAGLSGNRTGFFPHCLVVQERSGLHSGDIWRPRAASLDISNGKGVKINGFTNVANMDGDHVLLGFLDDDLSQPVVLRSLPHPSADIGSTIERAGYRLRLVVGDGDPRFIRHNGVFHGVDAEGNYVLDATFGNDGVLASTGAEPSPTLSGVSGNYTAKIPINSTYAVDFTDTPDDPDDRISGLVLDSDRAYLQFERVILGDGGTVEHVIKGDSYIAAVAVLHTAMKTYISAVEAANLTLLGVVTPLGLTELAAFPLFHPALVTYLGALSTIGTGVKSAIEVFDTTNAPAALSEDVTTR